GKNLRVIVSVDDGGLRAFVPLTDSFIVSPEGLFVGRRFEFVLQCRSIMHVRGRPSSSRRTRAPRRSRLAKRGRRRPGSGGAGRRRRAGQWRERDPATSFPPCRQNRGGD